MRKPKPMTHVGMVRIASRLGYPAGEYDHVWLRETPKCWIDREARRWKKSEKRPGGGERETVFATAPGGFVSYELKLETVRPLTPGEFREPLLKTYTEAKRVLTRAQEHLEIAEQSRSDALGAALAAKTELDRFDREHDIHEESPYE